MEKRLIYLCVNIRILVKTPRTMTGKTQKGALCSVPWTHFKKHFIFSVNNLYFTVFSSIIRIILHWLGPCTVYMMVRKVAVKVLHGPIPTHRLYSQVSMLQAYRHVINI